jgi:hypothetical protein
MTVIHHEFVHISIMVDGDIYSENTLGESLARSGLMVQRQLPDGLVGAHSAFRAWHLDHPPTGAKISVILEGAEDGLV